MQPSARIGSKFLHIFSQDDRDSNAFEITFERTFGKENATFLVQNVVPAGERDLVIVHVESTVKQIDITPNFLVLEPQEVAIVAAESKEKLE